MGWLCIFLPHKWIHIFNIPKYHKLGYFGLYQCQRCKQISKGSPRED